MTRTAERLPVGGPSASAELDRALAALTAVSHHLQSSGGDLRLFFEGLTATIATLVNARRVGFCSFDPGGGSVSQQDGTFGFSSQESAALTQIPTDPRGTDLGGRIAYFDEVFCADVGNGDPQLAPYLPLLHLINAHDGLAVAWTAGTMRLGVVHVWDSTRGRFSAEDVRVLRTAAQAAGMVWHHHMAMRQLRDARSEAEAASTAKSDFLSRISHELRTPLSAVLGYAELLELTYLDDQQREQVGAILRGANHLLELIGDILDMSRIDAGTLPVSMDDVDLKPVIDESLDLVMPLAADRDITLRVGSVPRLLVRGDRQRILQILVNLVGNAVKYNRKGGDVMVSVTQSGDVGVRVSVRDTGGGITPENLARLFVPFERLDAGARGIDGTGLGLALSRHLVEAMNGSIGVRSTPGDGSTFWIDLERVETDVRSHRRPEARSPVPVRSVRETTVLYIEDSRTNVDLVAEMLARRPGLHVVAAVDGATGIRLAQEHRPDFIFLDAHLPDMPGEQVISELLASDTTKAIPVIVLSADATAETRQRLEAAGARAYLAKPISVRTLLSAVDELLGDQ